MKPLSIPALFLAAAFGLLAAAEAGHHGHCHRCNCSNVRKVCRLVPDVKKTTTFQYSLVCEDYCLNGCSKCAGCKEVCDCNGCKHCEKIMKPTCCKIQTKAKLMKTPVVKETHGWKCVVVCICGGCNHCVADSREATAEETQLAIAEAQRQGILQVAHEEPILVEIETPEDAVPATVAQPLSSGPLPAVEASTSAVAPLAPARSAFEVLFRP
ncbi:MAG: hypothetical protein C0483_15170 [Pirellula sp.]|nr:hypothetical protein [Pirellula sp.]